MGHSGALAARFLLLSLAGGLAACSVADRYSGHAVLYNLEAEQAQQQALLLNIVRSSMRRPMQFSSVTSITGNTSSTTSATFLVPFNLFSSTASTGTFAAQLQNGPNFTVPVLDTQEFYQGILNPMPGQLIDLLLHANYSPELLFNLLIEKIEMTRLTDGCGETTHWTECEFYVLNDPGSDVQIELFHTLVRYLVALGMSTEPLKPPDSDSSDSSSKKDKKGDDSSDSSGDSTPLATPYAFCFAPKNREVRKWLNLTSYCGY